MTFDEFMQMALDIDPAAVVEEDADGTLSIHTLWAVVGDEDAPLAYFPDGKS